jgi:hypothetical protein
VLTFKKINVCIIYPNGARSTKFHRPPKGKMFTDIAEESLLYDQATFLEEKYKDVEWRMVKIGPHSFNFIGKKL